MRRLCRWSRPVHSPAGQHFLHFHLQRSGTTEFHEQELVMPHCPAESRPVPPEPAPARQSATSRNHWLPSPEQRGPSSTRKVHGAPPHAPFVPSVLRSCRQTRARGNPPEPPAQARLPGEQLFHLFPIRRRELRRKRHPPLTHGSQSWWPIIRHHGRVPHVKNLLTS